MPAKLLCCFFVTAGIMTIISQLNYYNNLVEVTVLKPTGKTMSHTEQYIAEVSDGYSCSFTMLEEGEFISVGDKVSLHAVKMSSRKTVTGVLQPYYEQIQSVEGTITKISHNANENKYIVSAVSKEVLVGNDIDIIIAEVTYIGKYNAYVIPYDCIVQATREQDSSMVFLIEEVQKVWGTEYRLTKKPVNIIETNGEEVAISNNILVYVVGNAVHMQLYEGKAVKIMR